MSDSVTYRSKYLEVPQELRSRIVNIYTASTKYRRKAKEMEIPLVEEIEYKGISNELEMVGMRTDEVKCKVQEKLTHLEDIRDYVKEVCLKETEQRKAYISDIIKTEMRSAEENLAMLEERMRALIERNKPNVLQSIQLAINKLSQKIENIQI
ncbi:hypothetical protein NEPAR06_1358 [Nematocida parisii]|uniref:Uncharacterized protein n=1 Tax=Nematocida parisii (strain ERTm3) TaxID=935791 RepID=I3EDN5_NEMP3|nr:uncharacterized protein NEPG_01549 [Nematocida parisii ERTm1]EIJ87332.1 hypothetical protein NEQG_02455 [Nematocida parisii ERTm3]KAI5129219.1 hypothetical protein NEPAR08_1513 [Nematocida parisii]EIJ93977.1 hypothetical protein NEPG_01549 [Nematocida parisii ERTm1]KAI5130172.1 hypothetical protein NEPAR03_1993 [Nematocida parisii]KAI5143739.1 hypothetical protein NEPAR04_1935 [Nematocida parisii]|eukprot:XP_013059377.1 hypothetical protein NEPG_01549 [Nematocida parisii ERTm1]